MVVSPTTSISSYDDELHDDSIQLLSTVNEEDEGLLYSRRPPGLLYVLVLCSGFGT